MTCHVNENVWPRVRQQAFRSGSRFRQTTGQQTDKVFHRDFITTIIDLNIVSIDIDVLVLIVENGCRSWVSRIACHVIGHHQQDLRIRNAQSLDTAVHWQHVGHVAIIEPESEISKKLFYSKIRIFNQKFINLIIDVVIKLFAITFGTWN